LSLPPDQIISVIEEFMEQQDRRNTLSQQAIRCAKQALSFKKHGEVAVTAYQKLLERTGKH
jgi:hypothetical protein